MVLESKLIFKLYMYLRIDMNLIFFLWYGNVEIVVLLVLIEYYFFGILFLR